jgi:hypothetical protein
MSIKTWALVIGGAAAITACASSPSEHSNEAPIRALLSADVMMFVSFDTNADFSVSADEVQAGIEREFARADANHDGQLQPIEFQNWSSLVLGGSAMGPFRLDFDRNVDNVITREEFVNEINARVRDYDTDSSGALSRSEFVRLVGQARPPTVRRPMGPMGPGGMGGPGS